MNCTLYNYVEICYDTEAHNLSGVRGCLARLQPAEGGIIVLFLSEGLHHLFQDRVICLSCIIVEYYFY